MCGDLNQVSWSRIKVIADLFCFQHILLNKSKVLEIISWNLPVPHSKALVWKMLFSPSALSALYLTHRVLVRRPFQICLDSSKNKALNLKDFFIE